MEDKWVEIHKFFNVVEAQRLEAILKENGIPVNIVFREDSVFSTVFKPALGEGIIMVKEDFSKKAKKIIEEFNEDSETAD